MIPLQVKQNLAKLIIDYCQAKNDGEHATAEQILFKITQLKDQHYGGR